MIKKPEFHLAIGTIPHSLQRYNTVGDYQERDGVTFFRISETGDKREMLLVMIHEVIEWVLCQVEGISNEAIDNFDLHYKSWDNPGQEPGDDSNAPYYRQHQFATGIERILAAEMGVDWPTYERHLEELT